VGLRVNIIFVGGCLFGLYKELISNQNIQKQFKKAFFFINKKSEIVNFENSILYHFYFKNSFYNLLNQDVEINLNFSSLQRIIRTE
jgi:hypothetical protein